MYTFWLLAKGMNPDLSAKIFSLASSVLEKSVLPILLGRDFQVKSTRCAMVGATAETLSRWMKNHSGEVKGFRERSYAFFFQPSKLLTLHQDHCNTQRKVLDCLWQDQALTYLELSRALCCKLQCWPNFHIAHHPENFGGDGKGSLPTKNLYHSPKTTPWSAVQVTPLR